MIDYVEAVKESKEKLDKLAEIIEDEIIKRNREVNYD